MFCENGTYTKFDLGNKMLGLKIEFDIKYIPNFYSSEIKLSLEINNIHGKNVS